MRARDATAALPSLASGARCRDRAEPPPPAAAAAGAAAAVAWRALWQEPRSDRVRERDLALPGWPEALAGLRVALLSDLHAGAPHVREERIERLVAAVNARGPDLVLLLGDYVDPEVPFGGPVAPGDGRRPPRRPARAARRRRRARQPRLAQRRPRDARGAADGGDRGARERAPSGAGGLWIAGVEDRATAARTSGARCATCRTARR